MDFACLIELLDGSGYVSEELRIVAREDAVIERQKAAIERARLKFGEDWQNYCRIIEADWSEWTAYIGRRGGQKVTPRKLEHLRKVSRKRSRRARAKRKKKWPRKPGPKAKRGPKKRIFYWWYNAKHAICAINFTQANRFAKQLKMRRGQVKQEWHPGKPDPDLKDKIGLYRFENFKWTAL
jgi:hypothetical protein